MLPEKATLKSSVLYSLPIVMIYQPTVLPSSGKRFSEDCRWGVRGRGCHFLKKFALLIVDRYPG